MGTSGCKRVQEDGIARGCASLVLVAALAVASTELHRLRRRSGAVSIETVTGGWSNAQCFTSLEGAWFGL